mgnify:CR=1 FL=1
MGVRTHIVFGYGFKLTAEFMAFVEENEGEFQERIWDMGPDPHDFGQIDPVMLVGDGMDDSTPSAALVTESSSFYCDYPHVSEGFPKFVSADDPRIEGWKKTLHQFAQELGTEAIEFGFFSFCTYH